MQDIQRFTLELFVLKVALALSLAATDWWCFETTEVRVAIRAKGASSLVGLTALGTRGLTIM